MAHHYTVTEAADVLGLNRRTVMRWLENGRIRGHKTPGGHWRINAVDLERADLTAAEFAGMVGVHPLTVRRWCEAGKVDCRKTSDGGHWLVPMSEVGRVGARSRRKRTT